MSHSVGELIPKGIETEKAVRFDYTCGCFIEWCGERHWHISCPECDKVVVVRMSGELPWHPTKGRGRGRGCPGGRQVISGLARIRPLPRREEAPSIRLPRYLHRASRGAR